MTTRRLLLVLSMVTVLAGCAAWRAPPERIVETSTGRTIDRAELLAALRGADVVLLGELHDDPLHHRRRGELIAALGPGAAVVAEHLTRGRSVAPQGPLPAALADAGFDARAWEWPLHEPLFAAVRDAGLPLSGGNLPADAVRRVAREGEAAWPSELAAALRAAPLDEAAQAALDADLLDSHCGHLPPARVPAMRAAQRARDAAMAQALLASGGRPAVLVAGNGHVRSDYGVPRVLASLRPGLRQVSVAFVENAAAADPATYRWITPPVSREDPCAGMAPMAAPG